MCCYHQMFLIFINIRVLYIVKFYCLGLDKSGQEVVAHWATSGAELVAQKIKLVALFSVHLVQY